MMKVCRNSEGRLARPNSYPTTESFLEFLRLPNKEALLKNCGGFK